MISVRGALRSSPTIRCSPQRGRGEHRTRQSRKGDASRTGGLSGRRVNPCSDRSSKSRHETPGRRASLIPDRGRVEAGGGDRVEFHADDEPAGTRADCPQQTHSRLGTAPSLTTSFPSLAFSGRTRSVVRHASGVEMAEEIAPEHRSGGPPGRSHLEKPSSANRTRGPPLRTDDGDSPQDLVDGAGDHLRTQWSRRSCRR